MIIDSKLGNTKGSKGAPYPGGEEAAKPMQATEIRGTQTHSFGMAQGSAILCILCLGLVAGCDSPARQGAMPRTADVFAWDSPRMHKIREEWDRLDRRPVSMAESRDHGQQKLELLASLLRKLKPSELEELVESFGTMPERAQARTQFQNSLLSVIFVMCIELGQRDTLVRLIACRCPKLMNSVEYVLVVCGDKYFQDPIYILTVAFDRCKAPAVRVEIAKALRRAFPSLDQAGESDAKFVRRCREWYAQMKPTIEVNREYVLGPIIGQANPLFLPKVAAP